MLFTGELLPLHRLSVTGGKKHPLACTLEHMNTEQKNCPLVSSILALHSKGLCVIAGLHHLAWCGEA